MVVRYRFATFELDPAQRLLSEGGRRLDVSGRYFDALHLMVAEAGSLITKDRFHREVWNGLPVTDEALTQCVRSLRKALGDEAAAPRFIETVQRHGYRFVAAVEMVGAPPPTPQPADRANVPAVAAIALGGATAGMLGGIFYVSMGLIRPGLGASSTMLGFISLCVVLGFLGGGAIGLGMALGGRSAMGRLASATFGGLLIGGFASIVGRDLFALLFGKVPATFTGAPEAAVLGLAVGLCVLVAQMPSGALRALAMAPLVGALAGLGIAATGGQLLAASLVQLTRSFPESPLRFAALSANLLAGATMIEAALFCTCCAAALLLRTQLRLPQGLLTARS